MPSFVFNIAKGAVAEKARDDSIKFGVLLLKAAEVDATLEDYDDIAALLLAAGNTEADFTNYCVDPQTECLTRRAGWTRYDDLRPGDAILAYDPAADVTRWEQPREVFVNAEYAGPMWHLSMRGFSALTTPGHRWPILADGAKHVLTTEELPRSHRHKLIRSAPHAGPLNAVYSDAFMRIVAWYYTEGCLIRGAKSITISQSDRYNPVNVDDIRRDLKAIGARVPEWSIDCSVGGCAEDIYSRGMCMNHYQRVQRAEKRRGEVRPAGRDRREGLFVVERRRADGLITWDLTGDAVDEIIACAPGRTKVPTMAFLSALTPAQAAMFMDISIAGDGSPEWDRFDQHNAARMDAFMAAAVLAGYGPTVGASGTSCHLNRSTTIGLENVRREQVHYEGVVWCPVVASGHWVARRTGGVFVTGNSRKTAVTGTLTVNDTANVVRVDLPDSVFTNAGGAVNNTLVKLIVFYDEGGTDATRIPLTHHDFAITTNGNTITARYNVAGFFEAANAV